MKLSYKEWLIKQKNQPAHRHSLLALNIQEEFYKLKGLIPTTKNFFSSRSLNEFISLKQNEFDLHLLKLAILDDKKFNLEKIVNLPYSHKNRAFFFLIISLLKNKTNLVEHLIKNKLITDINRRIVSSFTLYHLILKTNLDLSICNPLQPNLKFMIPYLFSNHHCNFDPFIPVTKSVYKLLLQIKKSVDLSKEFNYNIFKKKEKKIVVEKEEKKEINLKRKKEFNEFKFYKLSNEEKEIYNRFVNHPFINPNLLYPIDFTVMKNDLQEFCKIVVRNSAALKYSKHAFYFCDDPNLGLRLYYYNCNYNQDTILFYVYKNNFGMVVLLLALGVEKKYLRVAALLCARMKHFTLLRLIMNSDKFSGDNMKSDKAILKLLCLTLIEEDVIKEENGFKEYKNVVRYELDREENKEDFLNPKIISCFSYELMSELSKYAEKPLFRNNVNFTDFNECTFDPEPLISFVKKLVWIKNKRWLEIKTHWWWNSQEVQGKNYANVINRFDITVRRIKDKDQVVAVNDLIFYGNKLKKEDLE